MKKLTCRDLGGACDEQITGNSFDELGSMCRTHVMAQMNNGDEAHQVAAARMKNASSEEQKTMMAEYEKRFNEAPNM